LGDRVVCVAKDLTKSFESVNTQRLTVQINDLQATDPKGEYVIVVSKADFSL
jgi:16S rRNA C1402 (ribose-2'-O) methylase RsmI